MKPIKARRAANGSILRKDVPVLIAQVVPRGCTGIDGHEEANKLTGLTVGADIKTSLIPLHIDR